MVLKFPFTRAASTNGLHRYSGFWGVVTTGDGGAEFVGYSTGANVAEVGVGDLFGLRGARDIDRLVYLKISSHFLIFGEETHPIELKNDILSTQGYSHVH